MAFPNLAGSAALLAILAAAACTPPQDTGRSERTRAEIDRAFGEVGPKSNAALFDQMKGRDGFSLSRVYSEKPTPFAFGQKAPESFSNALVIDVAIEMKVSEGFPVYRVGIEPKKITPRHIDMWPSHVVIDSGDPAIGELVARLPEDRSPDRTGVIWTDWTYCGDCFGLREMTTSNEPEVFDRLTHAYDTAAGAPSSGSDYARMARFTSVPGVGILIGEAALEMTDKASKVVLAAQARHADMAPARKAYAELVQEHAASRSPKRAVSDLCGTYEPNRDERDPAIETARLRAYQACAGETLERFDVEGRRAYLSDVARREAKLAYAAGLSASNRMKTPGVKEEMAAAMAALTDVSRRYSATPAPSAASPTAASEPAVTGGGMPQQIVAAPLGTVASIEAPVADTVAPAGADQDWYVARLLEQGANMDIGKHPGQCVGELACETGSVVALITAMEYCTERAAPTKTVPGWGLVVQKYHPVDAQQLAVLKADAAPVSVMASVDSKALSDGLAKMRALRPHGEQAHFASYPEFYEVNTEKLGCTDMWRDAAQHRVLNNSAEAQRY